MENLNSMPSSSSPSSSDTDGLNAPSAATSSLFSPPDPSFPSPASTYAEREGDGVCARVTHIQGTDASPEEGRSSVSSPEEMVRQHACDIIIDYGHDDAASEQQAWDASPIHQGDNLEPGVDANSRQGCDDPNGSQLSIDMYADAEKGLDVKRVDLEEERHECCRVCHLSVEKSSGSGGIMKLGCACKDDLALAHQLCAETWFKIKGNRTCEICGSTAQNIVGSGGANFIEQRNDGEANNLAPRRAERCWQNQPICNTVLVCVILVLAASWLFKVTVF